jgi:type II secretory pathway component PulC
VLIPAYTKKVKVSLNAVISKATEPLKENLDQSTVPPLQEYTVVAEKNLFHPDRVIPAKKDDIAIPRPEFVLYGTLITSNVSIAYISDMKVPRSTPGRGQRQTGLKIGETMSGYTLKEVHHDRVVMVHGDDRIEIKVVGQESKKKRGGTATATPAPTPATHAPVPVVTQPIRSPEADRGGPGSHPPESLGRARSRR